MIRNFIFFDDARANRFRQRVEVDLGEGPINCVRVSNHAGFEGQAFVACYSGAIARVDKNGDYRS